MASEKRYTLLRIEQLEEDDEMEVNPYVFMKKEEEEKGEARPLALGVEYDESFIKAMDSNLFYMGHLYILDETIEKKPSGFFFKQRPDNVSKPYPVNVKRSGNQVVQTQSLQTTVGHLTLAEYIKFRILDIAALINLRNYVSEPQWADMNWITKWNANAYVKNNSWTFPSMDGKKSFHLFCPLISRHNIGRERKYTLKFLRISSLDPNFDFTIHSFIYSITLENTREARVFEVQTPEGDVYVFGIELGAFNPLNGFPTEITYFIRNPNDHSECLYHTIVIPNDNPDDCVVVSMTMCGMLPQPDLTRYHNLFRSVKMIRDDTTNASRLEHILSYGTHEFIRNTMTRRIHSFYNRELPSRPLRNITQVMIYIGKPKPIVGCRMDRVLPCGAVVYVDPTNPSKPFINQAFDSKMVSSILDDYGCNRENVFFPVLIHGHQLLMSYQKYKDDDDDEERKAMYMLRDPQIGRRYLNLDHPNHYEDGKLIDDAHLAIFVAETNLEPKDFAAKAPQMFGLYKYFGDTPLYKGDPFPMVWNYINRFNRIRKDPVIALPAPLVPVQVRDSFVFDLSIKDITLERVFRELERLDSESLTLLQAPRPDISFDYYNRMITSLERVVETLSSIDGLTKLVSFAKEFVIEHGNEIIMDYELDGGSVYEKDDILGFLLSRPLFTAFAKEFCKVADNGITTITIDTKIWWSHLTDVRDTLLAYLSDKSKPVLSTVAFHGSIDRLLSYHSNDTIPQLRSLASKLTPFIKDDLFKGLEEGLQALADQLDRQIRDRARARVMSRIATTRVLLPQSRFLNAADIKAFIRRHPKVSRGYKEEFDEKVEQYAFFQPFLVDDSLVNKVLYDLLVHKLDYKPQQLETRQRLKTAIQTRVRGFRESAGPRQLIPLPATEPRRATRSRAGDLIDDYEQAVRRLESRVQKESIDASYIEPDEIRVIKENEIRDYIDIMIEKEIEKLEKDRNWTPLEKEQLREEIDNASSKSYDTSRNQDLLFVIVDMIREMLPQIDAQYLGRKSIRHPSRTRSRLL